MKGFVISLDAVIALSFIFFAMIIITSQSYQPKAPGSIYLKQLTLDTITVLSKTGRMDQAIGGNNSAIQEIVEATPKLACINIFIIDNTGGIVATTIKSDCNETTNQDIQTTASPVLYQSGRYIVKSEAWFREEPD